MKKFNDIQKIFIYHNYKRVSCCAIYDTQTYKTLKQLTDNLHEIKEDSIVVTADKNDCQISALLIDNKFKADYNWYLFEVIEPNFEINENIIEIKERKDIEDLILDQVHELSKRMPSLFDEKGEDDDWPSLGEKAIGYIVDNNIISLLTFSIKKDNTIHIYLTYTKPEYRSQGIGTKMFDYAKDFAYKNGIKAITVCTDISTNNPVPNMFLKNDFKYFKTSYTKIIKKAGGN